MKLLIPTFFKEHYPVAAMAMMAWAAYPAAATAAPSFDCGKASIAIEQAICKDEALADLDRRLAEVYAAQRQSSSKDLAKLAREQKKWLALARRNSECSVAAKSEDGSAAPPDIAQCLAKLYSERIEQLLDSIRRDHVAVEGSTGQNTKSALLSAKRDGGEDVITLENFDPSHVSLLYSENDKLCVPLGKLYDELEHRHLKIGQVDPRWIWEDSFQEKFKKIGMKYPDRVEGGTSQEYGNFSALYNLDLGGAFGKRYVLIQDVPWTSYSVSTDVFILNYLPNLPVNVLDNDTATAVDFGVVFGRYNVRFAQNNEVMPPPFQHIEVSAKSPYVFKKNEVYKNYSIVSKAGGAHNMFNLNSIDIGIRIGPAIIQRPFTFDGEVYITARDQFSYLVSQSSPHLYFRKCV